MIFSEIYNWNLEATQDPNYKVPTLVFQVVVKLNCLNWCHVPLTKRFSECMAFAEVSIAHPFYFHFTLHLRP